MIKPRTLKRTGKKVYDVRLRDPDGDEYSRTFATKRAAEDFEAAEKAARRHGAWIDPRLASKPLVAVAEEWLAADGTKRASSLDRDRRILDGHVLPTLGKKAVGSVSRADVQRLVKGWTATHAPSSVARMYSALRAMFSYAVASDLIVRNPCRDIRLPRVDLVDRPSLDAEQLCDLAAALGPDQATMMWLGAVVGLRWAECAGLTVGAVEVVRARLSVVSQLGRDGKLGPPKSSAGRRALAIPEWLADEVAALLARRGLTGADAECLVFVSSTGAPLRYHNWLRRAWQPACQKAGLPGLRFHDLRSLATTALIAEGVDIKTAQHRLGHSSPRVTLAIYARATHEADREAATRVGARFGPRDKRGIVRRPRRSTPS
jgi:integrase